MGFSLPTRLVAILAIDKRLCGLDTRAAFIQTLAVAKKPKFHCDVRASFATAFTNWRHKNRIPLKNIAKDLGVSVSTVSTWESGKRFLTGYNFEMLVEYTGVPPCKLFCVMADKCVPADCLLAMTQLKPRPAR